MTEPTDAEIEQLYLEETGFDLNDSPAALLDFARAVLAKWGQPAQAAEPVAWLEYARKKPSSRRLVFTRSSRKDLRSAGWVAELLYTAPQPVAREPVESSDRRWLCLLCKSSREGAHGVLDDSITPCPNGIKGGQHGTDTRTN